jgi:ribosomal protein S18 acetylase RimI-like enzyme
LSFGASRLLFRRNRSRAGTGGPLDRFLVQAEVTIRAGRREDLAYLDVWPGFDTPAHRQALRYYLQQHRLGEGAFLVADIGGLPVGQLFLWYLREDRELGDGQTIASITALRVWPSIRRQGVASKLAAAAEKLVIELGFSELTIGTDTDNSAAHRLYVRWGYQEFKRSTYEWDGRTYPQVCMRKRLIRPAPAAPPGGTE